MLFSRVIFLAIAVTSGAMADSVQKDMEKRIQERYKEFHDDFNSGDFGALANLYTDDCVFLPYKHPALHGKQAVEDYALELEARGLKKIQLKSIEVLPLAQGDADYQYISERGHFKFFTAEEENKVKGEYMVVWRLSKTGELLIHWDIFNEEYDV